MRKRTILLGIAAVAIAGFAVAAGVFFGLFQSSVVAKDVATPLTADEMKRLAPRGAYIATVADCYACHTAKGGAPWAGGMPFQTPFGTLYATNISPDKEFGIGNWTRADFHRAMQDGIGKTGANLYPAMPYTSYRQMSSEDVDAIFAYLMTREPMRVENRKNELAFPFSIRRSLAFWNLINLHGGGFVPDDKRSAVWNRGRYIVDALAHCGECHTPRNLMQGMKAADYLKGAVIEGVEAPDITKEGLTRMGFQPLTLAQFMKSGVSALGSMTNQMFEVVHFSTQYMRDEDLTAMSAYLFDLDSMPATSPAPPAPAPVDVPAQVATAARATYDNLCAGCHGANGQGIPHVAVPLLTNVSLRIASARNLVHAVLHGIPAQRFPGLERMEPMPGFADLLDDHAIADLANWMRARWGGQQPNLTAQDIAKLR
ncbi:cytochrome c [Pseudorhodoplanes sinuspersici]|uniref:Gluconate 2-dehydrogenase n=1 Tax=Pseudorhodoplanes sinuspersici TaxID=1235591 RepID=A0A1W6ZZ28_9HYPH|nr:cytochrome c [Pseudorhodoplanes sinuspersici]ARQ02518.1 gluconate 2-dehydrogenase [Pseudorhodoplanes sinuspersici]RKE74358.1 mono/diheme cytochrome c family protein [Pseudorhodoplanes sinuspersici]